ncbi:MAG: hypothetical protein M3O30_14210 [Planctomycetota bacterium]|nr:hypothetical protein [Planctomycetota bacterium]
MRSFPYFNPTYLREYEFPHFLHTAIRALRLPLEFFIGDRFRQEIPLTLHVVVVVVIIAIPVLRLRRKPEMLLWILWLVGVILPVAILDLLHQSILLSYLRYTILASPAAYALAASYDWPFLRDGVAYTAIVGLAMLAGRRLNDGVPSKMDFRAYASIVDSRALPDELLVFYNQSRLFSPGSWYMCLKYYAPDSYRPWIILHQPPDAELLRQLQSRDIIWLIGINPEVFARHILPGWNVQAWWETTGGGVCLMRRASPGSARAP